MSSNQKEDIFLSEQIERMKYSLDLENMWIENADNKVSVACALHAGIFAVFTFISEQIGLKEKVNRCLERTYLVTFALSFILLFIAVFFYVSALKPKLKSFSSSKGNHKSKYPLYFGDIANESFECYKSKMYSSTSKKFLDELIYEAHINAGICKRKMKLYKIGLWFTFGSILLSLVSIVARYFM
ncbi:MAG: DUF5706 domain-containing protein [Oscillospiraceae bacterium]|nr:DUF5706 domain-containing protein [Oscillospiraceae bacterium]